MAAIQKFKAVVEYETSSGVSVPLSFAGGSCDLESLPAKVSERLQEAIAQVAGYPQAMAAELAKVKAELAKAQQECKAAKDFAEAQVKASAPKAEAPKRRGRPPKAKQ